MICKLKEYCGYTATVEYSEEDGLFFGSIDGIKDSISFDSESILGIESRFHNAVDNYIDMCENYNKEPDEPER